VALFDGRRNKYLGGWSATPSPSEHRAQVESKYIIDTTHQQLGRDQATIRLNEITSCSPLAPFYRNHHRFGSLKSWVRSDGKFVVRSLKAMLCVMQLVRACTRRGNPGPSSHAAS
jgi:hypothetical protein